MSKNEINIIRKIVKEELLKEIDFIKLLPVQIDNAMIQLSKLKRASLLYNFQGMKRAYMDLYKQIMFMKKTIDGIV